jgi:hypothetical protein
LVVAQSSSESEQYVGYPFRQTDITSERQMCPMQPSYRRSEIDIHQTPPAILKTSSRHSLKRSSRSATAGSSGREHRFCSQPGQPTTLQRNDATSIKRAVERVAILTRVAPMVSSFRDQKPNNLLASWSSRERLVRESPINRPRMAHQGKETR